ncbi:MAG: VWA domain-containing protein [Bacteroidota bacterium]
MSNSIHITTGLDHNSILKGKQEGHIYLFVEVEGSKVTTTTERLPLNLGLVIDRSGSMSGKKIEYAREAVKFIIQNLASTDKVSLVQYDDKIDVLHPSGSLTNKQKMNDLVDQITARGSTNLSGGMMEGFHQVGTSFQQEGMVNRVFLLSDGLANQGIRDPKAIVDLAHKKSQDSSISLSSFGIGADFNEKLMIDLAEHAGGNQYFIGLPEDIPNIFAEELKGLLAVVAQNTGLSIAYPTEYLSFEKGFGFLVDRKGSGLEANLRDIFSEDKKAFLLKFNVNKAIDQELTFKLHVSYDDVLTEMKRIEGSIPLTLNLTEDIEVAKGSSNGKIMEQVALFESNSQHQALLDLLSKRRFDEVRVGAQSLIAFLENQLLHFPESDELAEQLKATRELFNELDSYIAKSEKARSMSRKHYSSKSSYLRYKKSAYIQMRDEMRGKEDNAS